jgi:hypothetical protein
MFIYYILLGSAPSCQRRTSVTHLVTPCYYYCNAQHFANSVQFVRELCYCPEKKNLGRYIVDCVIH